VRWVFACDCVGIECLVSHTRHDHFLRCVYLLFSYLACGLDQEIAGLKGHFRCMLIGNYWLDGAGKMYLRALAES